MLGKLILSTAGGASTLPGKTGVPVEYLNITSKVIKHNTRSNKNNKR
jgi:hypothetical protein